MLILKPIVHETIWGGERLMPYSGTGCRKIGHLYSVFQSDGLSNEIMNGSWKGQTLGTYFEKNKERLHLEGYPAFPLVIALVDAAEHLSIQVHPDDRAAQKLVGLPRGKNESWFFLEPPTQGSIFNGCNCGTFDEFGIAIKEQRTDKAVGSLQVEKGDYVYVEGGTLHALSAGSLVYEIEENVEITYRVYDFDRVGADGKKRPLQIDEALACIHLDGKSSVKRYGDRPLQERLYSTQKYEHIQSYTNKSMTLECFTILDGKAFVKQENMYVQTGQTILLEPQETLFANVRLAIVAQPK